MCLTVLSPCQVKYNDVPNPEEVYFLVTRVIYGTFNWLNAGQRFHILLRKMEDFNMFKVQFT